MLRQFGSFKPVIYWTNSVTCFLSGLALAFLLLLLIFLLFGPGELEEAVGDLFLALCAHGFRSERIEGVEVSAFLFGVHSGERILSGAGGLFTFVLLLLRLWLHRAAALNV